MKVFFLNRLDLVFQKVFRNISTPTEIILSFACRWWLNTY